MIPRPALAALLLALAACGSTPPGAIPVQGSEIDAALVARFVHRQGEARELVFSPDGALLAATGTDGRIELMRGAPGTVWRTIVHPDGASALAASPDGTMLISGGYDRTARIWRITDQRAVRVLQGSGGTIWSVAWSPDGSRIATAGEDRLIRRRRAAPHARRARAQHLVGPVQPRFPAACERQLRPFDPALGRGDRPPRAPASRP